MELWGIVYKVGDPGFAGSMRPIIPIPGAAPCTAENHTPPSDPPEAMPVGERETGVADAVWSEITAPGAPLFAATIALLEVSVIQKLPSGPTVID